MKKYVFCGGLLAISIFVSSVNAGFIGGNWMGTIYPDAGDLTEYKHVGHFDSLNECRDAARKALKNIDASYSGDYECGYKCQKSEYGDLYICKETKQ